VLIQVLVEDKIKAGKAIQDELRKDRFPINAAFWYRMPESGYWQLVIGSNRVDQLGPIKSYRQLHQAVARLRLPSGLESDLFGSISLLSPQDPAFKRLLEEAKSPGQSGVSWTSFAPPNPFQDAYFYDAHGNQST